MTGAATEPRSPSMLERFAPEKTARLEESKPKLEESKPRLEETKLSNFVPAGLRAVEGRPAVSHESPVAPTFEPDQAGPNADTEPGLEGEKLIDLRQIGNYTGFLARSFGRHAMLAAGTFSLAFAMTAAIAVVLPKTYHAGVKLLAQRNAVMAGLSNPGRAIPWDADAPTRAAAETILRRDNLTALAKRTNLVDEWERTRVPILKVKDWVSRTILRRRPTREDKLNGLVGLLEARMVVLAGPVGDGTVTIDLDWPNAVMAYRLVEAAQQAFVEARQVAETAAISEAIAILERSGTALHADIDRTLTDLQHAKAQRRPPAGTRSLNGPILPSITATLPPVPAAALGSTGVGADLDDPQIPRLKAAIATKRLEITTLEETRQRQLSELQGRLTQLTTVYTATHPSVVAVEQNIAAISRESPQVVTLKAETARLEAEYETRLAAAEEVLQEEQLKAETAKQNAVGSAQTPALQPREARTAPPDEPNAPGGPTTDFASLRLRLELNQLQSLFERTDGARIELAVSQAAFKYRYTVIRPAEVPKTPVGPNVQRIFIAGLLGSLLLALLAVVGKDLLSNRILEPWQIERQLGLTILGVLGHP